MFPFFKKNTSEADKEKAIKELYDYGLSIVTNAFKPNIPEWAKEAYEKAKKQQHEYLLGEHDIFVENTLNELETVYFNALCVSMKENNLLPSHLMLQRMSDKTLNVMYAGCQIGRIKLTGRKTKMQILTNNTVNWIENEPLEAYIKAQNAWIKYAKSL